MAFNTAPWLHWLPHPRFPEDEKPYEHRWPALFIVSLGVFLVALDVTIVGVAGPKLSARLGATATQIQWAFDAYTVTLGGFVVLGGGIAERYGRKGFVQVGMFVFATGAAICAFAPSIGIFIAGRVVSGLGAAVVFPACLSKISALFPPEDRPRAFGIFSTISAVGVAGGPLLGGILIHFFWWGAAFLVMIPVALVAIVAIAFVVPPSRRPGEDKLDLVGAMLSVLGLGGIVFGVIEGPDRGWGQALVLVPFSLGLLCTAGFIFWELQSKTPLFDLRVFKDSRVVGGALAMVVVYFTFQSIQLLLPQYLDYVVNLSSIQIGLTMLPFGLGLALFSPRSAHLVERHGQRKILLISLMFMAIGSKYSATPS